MVEFILPSSLDGVVKGCWTTAIAISVCQHYFFPDVFPNKFVVWICPNKLYLPAACSRRSSCTSACSFPCSRSFHCFCVTCSILYLSSLVVLLLDALIFKQPCFDSVSEWDLSLYWLDLITFDLFPLGWHYLSLLLPVAGLMTSCRLLTAHGWPGWGFTLRSLKKPPRYWMCWEAPIV